MPSQGDFSCLRIIIAEGVWNSNLTCINSKSECANWLTAFIRVSSRVVDEIFHLAKTTSRARRGWIEDPHIAKTYTSSIRYLRKSGGFPYCQAYDCVNFELPIRLWQFSMASPMAKQGISAAGKAAQYKVITFVT